MSDTWNDIQAIKNRQHNLRAKMIARRKQREGIVAELIELSSSSGAPSIVPANIQAPALEQPAVPGISKTQVTTAPSTSVKVTTDPEVEKKLLMVLCDISLDIPSDSKVIMEHTSRLMEREVDLLMVEELLQKFATQKLISIKFTDSIEGLIVNSLDFTKLSAMTRNQSRKRKYESDDEEEEEVTTKQMKSGPGPETGDIESLLSMQTTKEREEKKLNEEIQALLVTQTAKEQLLVEKFKSRGGPQLQEFCQFGTREECHRTGPEGANCKRLHFKKIIHKHTDESLGDCSFLNTCFHMDICKDSSNMAANVTPSTHQHISSGPLQQLPVTGWYYDYENNTNIGSHYPDHRQGPPIGRPYAPITCTNSAILNPSHVNSGPYPPAPIPDTSHISARAYSTVAGLPSIEQSRPYLISSSNTDSISIDPNRAPNLSVHRETTARPFPPPSNLSTAAEGHPSGSMPVAHRSSGSRDIRNIPERPYHVLTGAETTIAPPPLISDMPCTSTFQYSSSIPYTLTAPPPAPAASAVTSPPFTQVGDMSSFDLSGQVSYPWSLSGDLFPSTISSTEAKSLPKPVKLKCISGNVKKRIRHPEMWKKNLTKSKKLKGEEHVSRTGNVIPAKRVETVDCSKCSFKCQECFSEDLRQQLFDVFYSLGSNESQKQFVCQNVQESATKVNGSSKKEGTSAENKRKVCRKYFLPDTDNTRKQVCSKFFCSTLAIGKTFITHALRNKQFGCYVGKEKRGKPHNKIPDMLLEPARQHINAMLAGSSSASKKNSKKKCLERGLNITKMHEMYKHECLEKGLSPVSLSMYRRIFHTEF